MTKVIALSALLLLTACFGKAYYDPVTGARIPFVKNVIIKD